MDTQYRTIMYIGSKSRKDDRPNAMPNRVWPGTGSIVKEIPPTQAALLCSHVDEFIDVTDFSTEDLAKRAQQAIAAVGERRRQARSSMTGSAGGVLLEFATEDQLLEELEKRRSSRSLLADTTVRARADKSEAERTREAMGPKQRSDQDTLAEKIPAVVEEIFQRSADNPDLLDETGMPTKLAIEEALGFQITEDDYNSALGGAAPVPE